MSEVNQEKLAYLRNIIYLNIQKKEIIELTKNSIKGQMPFQCNLINKDIINDYMNEGISNTIYFDLDSYKIKNNLNNYSELYDQNHINEIINEKSDKINDIDLSEKFFNPGLLTVEDSKMNDIEYPSNFFILRKPIFEHIIALSGSILLEFKTYDVLIGKEGIFIWEEKPNEKNEFKFIIYYIKEIKNDEEYNINKIILLKDKTQKVLENLDKYLELTKFKDKAGYFNIIDDGKIIGKYLNIIKNTNFQYKESKNEQDQSKMKTEIENFDVKSNICDLFIPHILLSLSKIENLKQYLVNMEKNHETNGLIKIFINIIKKLYSGTNDLNSDISEFLNIFLERNLYEKCEISEDKTYIWKSLINLLFDEFKNELKHIEKKESTIIDIFNGIKNINNKEIPFNSIDIKFNESGNQDVNLIDLINGYKKEENVKSFPKVMIAFIKDENNFINIPSEFKLKSSDNEIEEKKYILRSSILLSGKKLATFVRNKNTNEFYKLMITDENKIEKEKFDDIKQGYIYFYEIEKTDNKNENINNNINEQYSNNNSNKINQQDRNNNNLSNNFNNANINISNNYTNILINKNKKDKNKNHNNNVSNKNNNNICNNNNNNNSNNSYNYNKNNNNTNNVYNYNNNNAYNYNNNKNNNNNNINNAYNYNNNLNNGYNINNNNNRNYNGPYNYNNISKNDCNNNNNRNYNNFTNNNINNNNFNNNNINNNNFNNNNINNNNYQNNNINNFYNNNYQNNNFNNNFNNKFMPYNQGAQRDINNFKTCYYSSQCPYMGNDPKNYNQFYNNNFKK